MVFSPGKNAVVCRYCDHVDPIEVPVNFELVEYDLAAALDGIPHASAEQLSQGSHEVQCKTCGARTVVTGQATRCVFCDSPMVVDIPDAPDLVLPETVLPFGVDDKSAGEAFATWMKSRWFAPRDLVKRAEAQKMDGVYLPYWTYSSETMTNYEGKRGDDYTETETYTDSNGQTQTRSTTRTDWSYASGTVSVDFADVLACGSTSVPDKMIARLEPWDVPSLRPFDDRYLAGFSAERYAVDLHAGWEVAKERMDGPIRSAINSDIGGDHQRIDAMTVSYDNARWKHALFPMWISAFRYQGKVFRVVVNARTGEVAGERPYSVFKIVLFIAAIIAAIIGIVVLVRSGHHHR